MHRFAHCLGIAWLVSAFWAGPIKALPGDSPEFRVYVVRRGDTLSEIARDHGVGVRQLRQWNDLKGDKILVGQRLVLMESKDQETRRLAALFGTWRDSVITQSRRQGSYALVVNKAQRRMDVYLAGKHLTWFPVAIGYADARELIDRQRAGDHHLKEGLFHLSEVAWDDNIAKWDRVWMRLHTVEWAKTDYAAVYGQAGQQRLAVWESRRGPIQTDLDVKAFNAHYPDAPLWRGLGIHGGGTKRDWTEGCIALDRKNIRWLYNHLRQAVQGGVGTPVAVVRF
jgi:transposase-like protein